MKLPYNIFGESHQSHLDHQSVDITNNIWFWISILELVIISILAITLLVKISRTRNKKLKEIQNSEVDMDNVLKSMYGSKDLFKKLSSKCHPDKFIDPELNAIATDIYSRITKNKRNHKELVRLKDEAILRLKISFEDGSSS